MSKVKIKVACVQVDTGKDIDRNLAKALKYVKQAKAGGADAVIFPENFMYIGPNKNFHLTPDSHTVKALKIQAKESGINVIGCYPIFNKGRIYNQAILFGSTGEVVANYSKIHLFKARLKGKDKYNETEQFTRGYALTTADVAGCKTGFSICFDLRFPVLYRKMALQGVQLAVVPSNFTKLTGKDHWLTLLRARAIENQIYIAAPNQCGKKADGRASFGHSCIIDPWGDILALKKRGEGIIAATVDLARVQKVRQMLPTLESSREQTFLR